ncbi:hypothetical protein ABZT47_07875 [Sphaerisporangium sp. NPDC005289]|uniref:hypothetical protein n=1 Tax=Sphaerisporangium sp. NPDC005289 TaxID=3155247 RepID=UPI0033AAE8E6
MTFTEADLRAALADDLHAGLPDVPGIVERGRRIRRRRTASALTLAGVVTATAAVLIARPELVPAAVDRTPVTAVSIAPPDGLPATNDLDGPLITAAVSTTMVTGREITFRPLSTSTSFKIVCDDPMAWVAIRTSDSGMMTGRCGRDGIGDFFSSDSVPSDWLDRPQRLTVWVFPADTPIIDHRLRMNQSEMYAGCKVVDDSVGRCDGGYLAQVLILPGRVEKLATQIAPRPGRWAIGVYDRPIPIPTPFANRTHTVFPTASPNPPTSPSPPPAD